MEKILELLLNLDAKVDNIDKRLDSVDQRLDSMDQRLDRVESRLDRVETRLDNVETRLDSMDTRLDNLESKMEYGFDQLRIAVYEVHGDVKELQTINDDNEKVMQYHSHQITKIITKIQ